MSRHPAKITRESRVSIVDKNMKKKLIFLIFILLTACVPQVETPIENPPLEIPYESLNEEFSVSAPKAKNINEIIVLKITAIRNTVIFRPDYQNQIFIYTKGEWIEVFHTPPECKKDNITLAPGESSEFSLYPAVPDLEEATLLRVYLFGYIAENGEASGRRVGAYTDVVIKP